MRTLLRKISSGMYFEGPDKWTSNPAKAMNFRSIDRALGFIQTWSLDDVELAFAFNNNNVTSVPLERTGVPFAES